MADIQLGETMTAEFRIQSAGAAYTQAALPFRPDYWRVDNLTATAENSVLQSYGYRGMTAAHAFLMRRMANDGGSDAVSLLRATTNGFTLTTNAAAVGEIRGVVTTASLTDPVSIQDVAHGLATGDTIRITDIVGTVELNNRRFRITRTDADNFTLQDPADRTDIDGTNFTALTGAGRWVQLNLVDADRTVFDAETFDLLMGTDIMAADNDLLRLTIEKRGLITEVGDVV